MYRHPSTRTSSWRSHDPPVNWWRWPRQSGLAWAEAGSEDLWRETSSQTSSWDNQIKAVEGRKPNMLKDQKDLLNYMYIKGFSLWSLINLYPYPSWFFEWLEDIVLRLLDGLFQFFPGAHKILAIALTPKMNFWLWAGTRFELGVGLGLSNNVKFPHCSWVVCLKFILLTCDRRLLAAIASISFHSVNSASASAASQMLLAPESTPGLETWRQWRGLAPATSTLSTSLTTHPGSSTAPLGRVSWPRHHE